MKALLFYSAQIFVIAVLYFIQAISSDTLALCISISTAGYMIAAYGNQKTD